MNLIQTGDFTLNSGRKSFFKFDCDAFTEKDWEGAAELIRRRVGPFGIVMGVPRGGIALQLLLSSHIHFDSKRVLLVDDVLTTGGSMESMRATFKSELPDFDIVGAVVIARGPCPEWITPVLRVDEFFWDK